MLDEDGVVPAEERAMQARGISAGFTRDGVVHRKMTLLPEIDAKFETLMNAYLNPRSKPTFNDPDPDAPKDPRATAQARHDVFASLIDGAARSADSPTIGGAAPTVLVSVRQADLDAGTGSGFIEGCEAPISMRAVEQFICAGGQQHVVIGPDGTINAIGTNDRLFNATQRRAISLRDGGCIIPGCSIPAAWSEIHHVKEHHDGGETETCNGVLLCWFHHHTHRDQRLADPDDQRGPVCETAALAPRRPLRRRHPLAKIDEVPHPTSRPPPTAASCWSSSATRSVAKGGSPSPRQPQEPPPMLVQLPPSATPRATRSGQTLRASGAASFLGCSLEPACRVHAAPFCTLARASGAATKEQRRTRSPERIRTLQRHPRWSRARRQRRERRQPSQGILRNRHRCWCGNVCPTHSRDAPGNRSGLRSLALP